MTGTKNKVIIPFEEGHRVNEEGVLEKLCNKCFEWIPLNLDNFYKNKSSPDGYFPSCKNCERNRAFKYKQENYETILKATNQKRYIRKREQLIDYAKKYAKENVERKQRNQLNWQRNNPDKCKEYGLNRMHKYHSISQQELNELYEYANHSCMYCGTPEEEALNKFKQRLHKDHAINEGSNGIDNCILACKECNSEKRHHDWDKWYTPENYKYTEERYNKIKEWLNKFKE